MDTRDLVTSLLKPVATDLRGKKGFFPPGNVALVLLISIFDHCYPCFAREEVCSQLILI